MILPIVKAIIGPVTATEGSETGHTKINLDNYRAGREFILTGRSVTNGTAPGSSKTITLKYYWSDVDFTAGSAAATVLADRVTSLTAKTLTDAADTTQDWQFTASPVRMLAPYCMVTYTVSSLATNADITLTVNHVVVPSTYVDL